MVHSGYDADCCGTCPCCPHKLLEPCPHTSMEEILTRICSLILDDIGQSLVDRQLVLMDHLLGIAHDRIKLKEVKYFTVILEFLCEFLSEIPQYKNPLWCLLKICQKPPKLTTSSEALEAEGFLSDYFMALGNCLMIVKDSDIRILLIEVLHNLLGKRDPDDVPFETCVRAFNKSNLSFILTQLIFTMDEEFYPEVLELTLKYAVTSKECGMVLLNSDVIYWLLSRLEFFIRVGFSKTNYVSELTSSIIWRLFSYLEKTKATQPLNYQDDILRLLRRWLRKEVLSGNSSARNDVATIICRLLYIFPCNNIVKSGVFEDISLLAFATEFRTDKSWAKDFKFLPNSEDLKFKKILIAAICAMFKYEGIRMVANSYNALQGLALLLDTGSGCSETYSWPKEYKCQLILYALHALPVLAEYFPDDYIATGATQRILEFIQSSVGSVQHSDIFKCSLECLNRLIMKGICLSHFSESNAALIILDASYRLLKLPLSLMNQLLLCHCLILLSNLNRVSLPSADSFDLLVAVALEFSKRVHHPLEHDSKIDASLEICAANFLWQVIAKNHLVKVNFMEKGGVYLMLDWASKASLPVQVVILGILADLTMDIGCILQVVTWRGSGKKETILSFLASVWRKQEAVKGVKRDKNGCINDEEYILEGHAQRGIQPSWKYCPPIAEMLGCARSKIYAVYYNISRHHIRITEAAKSTYGIDYSNVDFHDEITSKIINHYEFFKKGEVWRNLWASLDRMDVKLLPQIEISLRILAKTYLYIAANVATEQQNIMDLEEKKELDKEKTFYDGLRFCMLNEALESFMYIRRDLYLNSMDQTLIAKAKFEKEIAEHREREDLDVTYPEYHATEMVGFSLPTGPPTQHSRIRKNSNILKPNQFLDKKEFKMNPLLAKSSDST